MTLYCGIDLHSNNSVVAVLDEQDRTVYEKRLEVVAPGHPWPPRHRCFPAQWNRTTDTRIFKSNDQLILFYNTVTCGVYPI